MPDYALLANPGHNRVYFEESKKLSAAELRLAAEEFSSSGIDISAQKIAGVDYLTFHIEKELEPDDIAVLSRLSFVYAIFCFEENDGNTVFYPIPLIDYKYISDDIGTILKYTGKTNELFTRMMINLAMFSAGHREFTGKRLLDPLAGKGTTLFEGLVYGMDVYGIEIGAKPVADACHYIQKYLQTGKYKFSMKNERVSGENKSFTAERHHFELARDKDAARRGEHRTFELFSGNSMYANKLYKKLSFDVIVADLPYGVQHGSVTNERQSSLTRNPRELLRACLPAWRDVLKDGGAMALAWNINIMPRVETIKILEYAGLTVQRGGVYEKLSHRVDQAIMRDVIIARKL